MSPVQPRNCFFLILDAINLHPCVSYHTVNPREPSTMRPRSKPLSTTSNVNYKPRIGSKCFHLLSQYLIAAVDQTLRRSNLRRLTQTHMLSPMFRIALGRFNMLSRLFIIWMVYADINFYNIYKTAVLIPVLRL